MLTVKTSPIASLFRRAFSRTLVSVSDVPTRENQIDRLKSGEIFDILIIGGGATGSGIALDAATRGLSVAMVEREDFSSGTSSRSTKLVHGGVRYLEKAFFQLDYGQFKLVRNALRERYNFLKMAPHLTNWLPIMLPLYKWWQVPYFLGGVISYDLVAGRRGVHRSFFLSKKKALEQFPMLQSKNLVGAVVYYDGQMNDTRMNVSIALTAAAHGGCISNYVEAIEIIHENGKAAGALLRDIETGETWKVKAKTVIGAAGPYADEIRKMDDPNSMELVQPSSGTHLILPDYYSPSRMGLIDPATSDGRVIFFLPWLNHTICGTTDAPAQLSRTPAPTEEEVNFILREVDVYLSEDIKVRRSDVLSAWNGIRPLVRDPNSKDTAALSRDHVVHASETGLITVVGGKWTTYREMAQDAVDAAIKVGSLKPPKTCQTENTYIIGGENYTPNSFIQLIQDYGLESNVAQHLSQTYGDQASAVAAMSELTGKRWPRAGKLLVDTYPYLENEVIFAAKYEYARTVVDIIARRTRLAFLNVDAARESIKHVTALMANVLGWDEARCHKEKENAKKFLDTFIGPRAALDDTSDRFKATKTDLRARFDEIDDDKTGTLGFEDIKKLSEKMSQPLSDQEIAAAIIEMDTDNNGEVDFEEFVEWWNSKRKSRNGSKLAIEIHQQHASAHYP